MSKNLIITSCHSAYFNWTAVNERIKSLSAKVEGVQLVEKCYLRKMGTGYHVDMHI